MKKVLLTVFALFIMALSTGCWEAVDISNQAFVTTLAIDKGEGNKKFIVSTEIVKPGMLFEKEADGKAYLMESAEGDSIAEALEHIQTRIPRLLSLSHLRVMLVGEALAKDHFFDAIEFIQKYPEKALRLRLMFIKDTESRAVLAARPAIGRYIAEDLVLMSRLENKSAMMHTNKLIDFIGDMRSRGGQGMGTMLSLEEEGQKIIYKGTAVFDKYKLVGWLDGSETKAANWIVGDGYDTVLLNAGHGIYAYCVEDRNLSIKPVWNEQGALSFTIRLKTDGILVDEQGYDYDMRRPQHIAQVEKIFSEEVAAQIRSAVEKSQKEIGVDYLGLGEYLYRQDPQKFKALDWEKVYPDIPVNVEVNCLITRFGLSP
ncbi:MAG: Ger(x)C family spore germination protein [Clostridia bacterium]|jgi:spore germination protein KC|nr:Ger(x)C family spore germination protein [Clostridia bacterium]